MSVTIHKNDPGKFFQAAWTMSFTPPLGNTSQDLAGVYPTLHLQQTII